MSNFLVGKTIKDIKIADDKLALLFICEDGEHIVKVDADCCSETWIESIELPVSFPCKVLSQGKLDLDIEAIENNEYESLAFYGYKIQTARGDITIDYRNISNGYYGGDIVFPDEYKEYYYGGVWGQAISNNQWVDVEDASL